MFEGLSADIAEINRSVTPGTQACPGGRAYLIGGQPFFDVARFEPVSESIADHDRLMKHLREHPLERSHMYMGTAGEVNLSYIANSRAGGAVLFDINPVQTMFWQGFIDLLAASWTGRSAASHGQTPRIT